MQDDILSYSSVWGKRRGFYCTGRGSETPRTAFPLPRIPKKKNRISLQEKTRKKRGWRIPSPGKLQEKMAFLVGAPPFKGGAVGRLRTYQNILGKRRFCITCSGMMYHLFWKDTRFCITCSGIGYLVTFFHGETARFFRLP